MRNQGFDFQLTTSADVDHSQTQNLEWSVCGHIIDDDINLNDHQITGIDNLVFTDVLGQIAGIQNQNLLDKTASETISGIFTFSNTLDLDAQLDADLINTANAGEAFIDFYQEWAPASGNGTGTQTGFDMSQATGTSGITYQNMIGFRFLQFHGQSGSTISQMFGIRCQSIIGGVFSEGNGSASNVYANECQVFINTDGNVGTGIACSAIIDHRGSGTTTDLIGIFVNWKRSGTGTVTNLTGIQIERTITNGAWTIDTLKGIWIRSLGVSASATLTNPPIGIDIADNTHSNAVAIRIDTWDYIFDLPEDNTDPTSGGGAATGRIPIQVNGNLRYMPYYT